MRTREQFARRLSPKDKGAVRRVKPVGRVGLAALELAHRDRSTEAVDVHFHPGFESGLVKAQPLADIARAGIRLGSVHVRRLGGEPCGCQRVAAEWLA